VRINIGQNNALVAQAETVLAQARKEGKELSVYALDLNSGAAAFLSVGLYNHLTCPAKPSFYVQFPITWFSPSAYHLRDFLRSRYIVFVPVSDPDTARAILVEPSLDDFWQEYDLFHSWFSTLNENDGVRTVSETSSRLIEIINAQSFRNSLAVLVKNHSWPRPFITVNSDFEDSPIVESTGSDLRRHTSRRLSSSE
jgi:hypothetical protein